MGRVRRSQAITTYGIGAIVDLPAGSVMPLGLEEWQETSRGTSLTPTVIHEPRLQTLLGTSHFRLPPTEESLSPREGTVDARQALPCTRFPAWHECPTCHRLGTLDDPFAVNENGTRLICRGCGPRAEVNPVRFVTACGRGHIGDFPWIAWSHRRRSGGVCDRPMLFLSSRQRSSSLADLFVECRRCKASASLGEAFSIGLPGLRCDGSRPWLGDHEHGCTERLRALQRGASNIHFPVVASALSIPPVSGPYFQILEEHWTVLENVPAEAITPVLSGLARTNGVDVAPLQRAYEARQRIGNDTRAATQQSSREEEYQALSTSFAEPPVAGRVPHFCNDTAAPPSALAHWFDLVGAVSRLREVRALAGFTRIEPYPVAGEGIRAALDEGRISPLCRTPMPWLPAAEIRGEGVFLRFRQEALEQWMDHNPALSERAALLDGISADVAAARGFERAYSITPRLLLIHSFAHALIRQLSVDCGYSSAALRERLYVSEDGATPMNGVLVYTGSPDSEGSLGGLVRLASPALLTETVHRAVLGARWCGSDPVCLETNPRLAGERASGAACHCCLLVPETACEKFNRELDRSMLVGDSGGRWAGFFADAGR
jgi:hypothetical protein